jgi:putative tryptophan/tyrosine transport system substrate-binding protein
VLKKTLTVFAFVWLTSASIVNTSSAERLWHIGACHVGLDHTPPHLPALREKLRELGYVDGVNLRFEFRNLADEAAAAEAARDFIAEQVDLIVAFESQCARVMQHATSSIPIIFSAVPDPVALGLVKSLARPGTNLTGVTAYVVDPAKPIQLLKEINPALRHLLVIIGPSDTMQPGALTKIREAAGNSEIQIFEKSAITPDQVAKAFASVPLEAGDGVISASETNNQMATIARQALRHELAFAANRPEALEAGALFSYGSDIAASGADVAVYVDKVLKGAAPASLPVAQPTSFKLVISLKTAKAIGLRIPDAVLARADEVIE